MKRMSVFFPVALLVCAFASRANAQGTVTWDCGYPQAGGSSGSIVGQGTATADCGWVTDSSIMVTYWPAGGGLQQSESVAIDCSGNWNFTITVPPGATYNITVQVLFFQCDNSVAVSPDPVSATAAP